MTVEHPTGHTVTVERRTRHTVLGDVRVAFWLVQEALRRAGAAKSLPAVLLAIAVAAAGLRRVGGPVLRAVGRWRPSFAGTVIGVGWIRVMVGAIAGATVGARVLRVPLGPVIVAACLVAELARRIAAEALVALRDAVALVRWFAPTPEEDDRPNAAQTP